jgi:hypothetical protein
MRYNPERERRWVILDVRGEGRSFALRPVVSYLFHRASEWGGMVIRILQEQKLPLIFLNADRGTSRRDVPGERSQGRIDSIAKRGSGRAAEEVLARFRESHRASPPTPERGSASTPGALFGVMQVGLAGSARSTQVITKEGPLL